MTSNVGSEILVRAKGLGFKGEQDDDRALSESEIRERILSSLRQRFKPEFLNRIDETIIFHPLSEKVFGGIVDLQLDRVAERLASQNITIRFASSVRAYLAKKGFDPSYGARPLKRLIQNEILDPLSLEILEKKVQTGESIEAILDKERVIFKKVEKRKSKR
jgi:ATP-dependent Clp protease ATP-binding subunit ClpA